VIIGFQLLLGVDNQSAFWSLYPYVYGKIFPALPFSPAMATVVTEQKNGNDKMERQNGNRMVETRYHAAKCVS